MISLAAFQESEEDLHQQAVYWSGRLKLKSAELGRETYSAPLPVCDYIEWFEAALFYPKIQVPVLIKRPSGISDLPTLPFEIHSRDDVRRLFLFFSPLLSLLVLFL